MTLHSLTVPQAAARLGISPGRVRQLIAAGRLRARKPARDWLIRARDLAAVAHRTPGRPVTTGAGVIRQRRAHRRRLAEALQALADAAEVFTGDQAGAPDPRCGLVQPVTVAEVEALVSALRQARRVLEEVAR